MFKPLSKKNVRKKFFSLKYFILHLNCYNSLTANQGKYHNRLDENI